MENRMSSFRTAHRSARGRRQINQDSIRIDTIPLSGGAACTLLILADGMGGAPAGDVASRTAVKILARYFENKLLNRNPDDVSIRWLLERSYASAHAGVVKAALMVPERSGMGTTLVTAVIIGNTLVIGNVGDSRAYLIDSGDITQLTKDHTVSMTTNTTGTSRRYTGDDVRVSHALTNVIGDPGDPPRIDIFPESDATYLSRGQIMLLCSDGLYNGIDDDTIHTIVCSTDNLVSAAEVLVNAAYHGGSSDNISVALLEYGRFPRRRELKNFPPPIPGSTRSNKFYNPRLIITALILVICIMVLGYISYRTWLNTKYADMQERQMEQMMRQESLKDETGIHDADDPSLTIPEAVSDSPFVGRQYPGKFPQ